MPERNRTNRLLEVGLGSFPAPVSGGTSFANRDLEYTGIELDSMYLDPDTVDDLREINPKSDILGGTIASLPFKDETFETVLMRSMFGQFKSGYKSHLLDTVTVNGIAEVFRVLRPGGEIVLVEENTPFELRLVESWLEYHGFEEIKSAEIEKKYKRLTEENSEWLKMRRPYFNIIPTADFNNGICDDPYIIIGKKPKV